MHVLCRILGVVAILAMAPLTASAQDFRIPVDSDFRPWGFSWNGGQGKYTAMIKLMPYKGKLALCGTGFVNNVTYHQLTQRALVKTGLEVGGKLALRGFGFFTQANGKNGMLRKKARCRTTMVGWPLPKNVDIDIVALQTSFRD